MAELQVSINFADFQVQNKFCNFLGKHLDILSTRNKFCLVAVFGIKSHTQPLHLYSLKTTDKSPKLAKLETNWK
jgi:hypothetical protein